jgi:hypothetical protein
MPDDSRHGWTSLADLAPRFDFESGRPQKPKPGTTRAQLEDLIAAREAEPEAGFITRILLLCSLPRTDPKRRLQYVRRNGPYSLIMTAAGRHRLPYGTLPRLLLAWACTEAVRTHSRTLVLGRSLAQFMRKIGIDTRNPGGGPRGDRTRLLNQIDRLFAATIHLAYDGDDVKASVASPIAERTWFLWDRRSDEPLLFESTITLAEPFFNEILNSPVPIDLYVLRSIKRSSLGIDLYMWLTYRTFDLERPLRLPWKLLYRQFAPHPERADDKFAVRNFRKDACRELVKIKTAWPGLDYSLPPGCLKLRPSPPPIPALPFVAP